MKAWVVVGLLALCGVARAEGIEVPEGDPLASLLQLIANWQASAPLAIGAGLIVIAVQALKKYVGDFEYKRVIIVSLGCVYALIMSYFAGLDWLSAAISVFVTSGGAIAIYEAIVNPALKLAKKNV